MKKTIQGPQGLRIVLDSAQIFPDDPGNGTPAIVELGRASGTYWCAADTGELICGSEERTLTITQLNWLQAEEQENAVAEFIETNSPA